MVGFEKGSLAWQQRMVGMIANDIMRLHEMYPEDEVHKETLKETARDLGKVIDYYFSDDKQERPIADVMCERIFGEK